MRVGTRWIGLERRLKQKDHPHACGDKHKIVIFGNILIGSSPCVWGQVDSHACYLCCQRIIPMRVGTSKPVGIVVHSTGDHPHACGDKQSILFPNRSSQGSSPCVWGQGTGGSSDKGRHGIIPMRVGTS